MAAETQPAVIHPLADVKSKNIGEGTRVWQFCVVLPGARIGARCNICAHVFVENDVVIGDDVTVKSGVQLWDGVRLGNGVFIGPNATFTNDRYPRSKKYPEKYAVTEVHEMASIGANSTILPGLKVGRGAMVGAGAVVTRDVPAYAIVRGNPARIAGYVQEIPGGEAGVELEARRQEPIRGVSIVRFRRVSDLRGDLLVAELARDVPFEVKRVFFITRVSSQRIRGEHAHKECHQLLVCLQGAVTVAVDNGQERQRWLLNCSEMGLYIHPMTWAAQYNYSPDAVLAVFASHPYDGNDYIRDYEEYLKQLKSSGRRDGRS